LGEKEGQATAVEGSGAGEVEEREGVAADEEGDGGAGGGAEAVGESARPTATEEGDSEAAGSVDRRRIVGHGHGGGNGVGIVERPRQRVVEEAEAGSDAGDEGQDEAVITGAVYTRRLQGVE
jgi:hypothetical protein